MNHCSNCKHWTNRGQYNDGRGICEMMDYSRPYDPFQLAIGTDPGSILTLPNFGCLMFEAE
jgi:hypothetical protein